MKEFFIGLIFLIAVMILAGIGILLYPLLLVLAVFLRIFLIVILFIFAIWLLGKFIVFVWQSMQGDKKKSK